MVSGKCFSARQHQKPSNRYWRPGIIFNASMTFPWRQTDAAAIP
jgi:hypothetical protein